MTVEMVGRLHQNTADRRGRDEQTFTVNRERIQQQQQQQYTIAHV